MGVIQIALIVAIVWFAAAAWRRYRAAGGDVDSLAHATRDGLRRGVKHLYEVFKGERGRGLQIVLIVGLVCFVVALSVWEIALLGLAIGALVLFASTKGPSTAAAPGPSSENAVPPFAASPPPPPPAAPASLAWRADHAARVAIERDRHWGFGRFLRWVMVVALVGVAAVTFTAAVARKAIDHLWIEIVERTPWETKKGVHRARDITPPARVDREEAGSRVQAAARRVSDAIRGEFDKELQAVANDPTVKLGRKIARQTMALASQRTADESVVEEESPTTTNVVFEPGSALSIPKPGAKATFLTEEFPTRQEADEALLDRVSEYLALALASSDKPFDFGRWKPDLEWTAAHFASDRVIHSAPDARNGVSLYTGDVEITTPNDRQIDQLWQRFLQDQGDARSWELGLSYAGAVSVIGALAIFLRLGTSRHIRPGNVPYQKKRWFRRQNKDRR